MCSGVVSGTTGRAVYAAARFRRQKAKTKIFTLSLYKTEKEISK